MVRGSQGPEPEMVLQLRDVIQTDGRSLNELEKLSGLAGGQLSRFVRGERDINFDAASRLCETLGIRFVLPRRGRPPKAGPGEPPPDPKGRGRRK